MSARPTRFWRGLLDVGVDVGRFTALGGQDSARQLLGDLRITYPAAHTVDDSPLRLYAIRSRPSTVSLDARSGAFRGNYPLLFAQVEYVRTILELAKARPLDRMRLLVGEAAKPLRLR
jgi:hypothetical protein